MLLVALRGTSQTAHRIDGSVSDSAGRPLAGISISMSRDRDTLLTVTDNEGKFSFSQASAGTCKISVSYLGLGLYDTVVSIPLKNGQAQILPAFRIRRLPKALEEVIVRPPPVTVLEDTLQFNAGAYDIREDATVEELIRKFPGMAVDRDGNITAQGKTIVKVLLNGKEFFAGDIRTATQNLPAEIVRNIQIIDDYGDQANLTGIKTGEPQKIININTRKAKNKGDFGNLLLGAGTDDRYLATLSVNRFRDKRQISFIGSANNTTLSPDALNGSGKSGMPQAAAAPGITRTYSAGLNYRDKWGEKLTVYGSYNLSAVKTDVSSLSYQQDLNPLDIRTTNRSSTAHTSSTMHRINWTMEYAASPKSLLKLSTTGSLSDSRNSSSSYSTISRKRFFTDTRNLGDLNTTNAAMAANLLYNHKFARKGRNLNVNGTWDNSRSAEHNQVNNFLTDIDSAGADSSYVQPLIEFSHQRQRQETSSGRHKAGLSLSYTEPLWTNTVAELGYSVGYEEVVRQRDVFDVDSGAGNETPNPGLSSDYRSTFLVNRYSLNIQSKYERFNYTLGLVMQPSRLDGFSRARAQETHTRNTNWAPAARIFYRLGEMRTLNFGYNGNYTEPDFQKLQPLVDSTNPSNIIVGNPNLKPEFSNRVSVSYNASDRESGNTLFTSLSYDKTLNKIVNSVFNDPRSTSRTTTYLNDNGFYRVSGNATVSRPFSSRRFTASAGLSGSFDNNIAYTDLQRSKGQSWRLQPDIKLQADIANVLDGALHAGYSLNRTEAVYGSEVIRTDTRTFIFSVNGRVFFRKDLFLGYAYDKQINSGYGGATNISPDILSLYIEYQFAKRKAASVRLQGFDLLDQNERISRIVSGTTITDNRYDGLRRYFMLTLGWRLSQFNG